MLKKALGMLMEPEDQRGLIGQMVQSPEAMNAKKPLRGRRRCRGRAPDQAHFAEPCRISAKVDMAIYRWLP
jgi:hypothetical protein